MNIEGPSRKERNSLQLNWQQDGTIRIILSITPGPVKTYEDYEIDMETIEGAVHAINDDYLVKLNEFKNPDHHIFTQFQKECRALYQELFSQKIRSLLLQTPYKDLELTVHDQLLHIPWELLFDGQQFLCERFNIGRNIWTRETGMHYPHKEKRISRLRILLIVDPTEDLPVAFDEGHLIEEAFSKDKLVEVVYKSSEEADREYVKKNLQDFDIMHYAGHVKCDPEHPHKSGWVLSDGIFSASDILKLADGTGPMPSVIFCNACQSGSTDKWSEKKETVDVLYASDGLVHAFMKAGTEHYIGTFSLISDRYGACMGIEFYRHFLQGSTIGESLRNARQAFKEKYGKESPAWINYVLYGDPCRYLIRPGKKPITITKPSETTPTQPKDPDPQSEILHKRVFPSFFSSKKRQEFLLFAILLIGFASLLFIALRFERQPRFGAGEVGKETDSTKEERIQETIELIRAILKERREKRTSTGKPSIPADLWTSTPMTITIFLFFDKSEPIPAWTVKMIKELDRKLTQRFAQDKRIRVAERNILDKILREKHLELIDLPLDNEEYQKLFGEFLFARTIILLEGFKSVKGGVYLCYKLIDVTKGEIYTIDSNNKLTKKSDRMPFHKRSMPLPGTTSINTIP